MCCKCNVEDKTDKCRNHVTWAMFFARVPSCKVAAFLMVIFIN